MFNVMYNGALVPPVSEETTIVSFANDLTVAVTAKRLEDVEAYATETVRPVKF